MKENFKKNIKEYTIITLGYVILAIAIKFFLAPNKIANGGITGVAIIVNYFIPKLSVGLLMVILNGALFILAFSAIDGEFGARTVYASMGLSILLSILDKFIPPTVAATDDLLLATLFGTLITGLGMGMIFNENASTGGTDIFAKMLTKFKNIDIGKALLIVDLIIALVSGFIFSAEVGMYGILSVILMGVIIDLVIEGLNACKSIIIISSKKDIIDKYIMEELKRGCTLIQGKGAYSGDDRQILFTVLDRKQFIKLKNYIKEIDPSAFIIVSEAHEVLGEGFKNIID
ncbi:YitT family protein [Clostridium botulinum C]|uniref:YitT family protein n=3 Tax=Clostridium botulinum TaxID=1491 RepID=A0A9Q4THX3_CLOBO|nr:MULTISPECIES: YitT family protein [Clostridium]AYF53636.1 YitT family protein [Clostridium novyi]EES91540.1 transporter [Clostridium botulinum D str. 1873]MCD3194698.1 YitT family protein [Clostridium botulinum C]MCD3200091.1 YitT family protein [Clostridium botulinum C]MCD3205566.1 YitT family protein [Clostridium botulinum C]